MLLTYYQCKQHINTLLQYPPSIVVVSAITPVSSNNLPPSLLIFAETKRQLVSDTYCESRISSHAVEPPVATVSH